MQSTQHAGWRDQLDLGDGVAMPLVGCGSQYGFADDGHSRGVHAASPDYVARALRAGFRLIDTARGYGTEVHVARGIAMSGLQRQDVFVVSKAWPGIDHPPGQATARAAIAESAANLGGYIDLFLVHQPVAGWQDLWRALEHAKDEGLVRAIGVSNFGPAQIDELLGFARHRPRVNQIHLHPFLWRHRRETVQHCQRHGIHIMAFPRSPWQLGEGTVLDAIAAATQRTRAQVMLRWAIEHRCAVIPLSTDDRHLADNFAVRDFRLTQEQVAAIDAIEDVQKLHFHVDVLSRERVAGWAFAPAGLRRIHVLGDDAAIGAAHHGQPRPDVQQAHAGAPAALASGFSFEFPVGTFAAGPRGVRLAFELASGERIETERRVVGG